MQKLARVRAPELSGRGGWLNTGGEELSLRQLRGRFVLLDFWTFCCVNCLHVLDELRSLEEEYGDVLVTVGVHSPKFAHEGEHAAVAAAVERYEVRHPVLDDPDLTMWQQYAVRAWPTLVLVDPEGYVVAHAAGEGHVAGLRRLLDELIAEHDARGTLHRGAGPYVPPEPEPTALRYPGKVAVAGDRLLVTDTLHHSVVELDGDTVVRRYGTGERGFSDGTGEAKFAEPQGILVLPDEVAAAVGYDVLVADTVNHALRALRTSDGRVWTVARRAPLSPWDLAWYQGGVVIAAAGVHQLWRFDPRDGAFTVFGGTTTEGLKDGPLDEAWFAQPSGLAADGERLWLVDAETSALRWIADGQVHTAVGEGLFDFGHVDGAADTARLQHPLGVAVLDDGSVAVADTYNNAVRRYDPVTGQLHTLATDVAEPSDAVQIGGELLVVESAAHRLTAVPGAPRTVVAEALRTPRTVTDLAAGPVRLDVVFTPPPGQRLDDRDGAPVRVQVSATPPELLVDGAGDGTELSRELVLAAGMDGVLHVTAQAAACDSDPAIAHPACHLVRQDWGVPVRVCEAGAERLPLVLHGPVA